jgi:hypothetical protein
MYMGQTGGTERTFGAAKRKRNALLLLLLRRATSDDTRMDCNSQKENCELRTSK